jgi:hypothetical protein
MLLRELVESTRFLSRYNAWVLVVLALLALTVAPARGSSAAWGCDIPPSLTRR